MAFVSSKKRKLQSDSWQQDTVDPNDGAASRIRRRGSEFLRRVLSKRNRSRATPLSSKPHTSKQISSPGSTHRPSLSWEHTDVSSISSARTRAADTDDTVVIGTNTLPSPPPSPVDGPLKTLDGPLENGQVVTLPRQAPQIIGTQHSQSSPNIPLTRRLSRVFAGSSTVRKWQERHRHPTADSSRLGKMLSNSTQQDLRNNLITPPSSQPGSPTDTNTTSSPVTCKDSLWPAVSLSTKPTSFPPESPRSHLNGLAIVSSKKATEGAMCAEADASLATSENSSADDDEQNQIELEQLPPIDSPVSLSERVAAVKIFIETHYESSLFDRSTPRSIRLRKLEYGLCYCHHNSSQRETARENFFRAESEHLRVLRALKARKADQALAKNMPEYETVRVLGKGSFGVVKLVREKVRDSMAKGSVKRPVFAMKVIRKSEMLRNCQEGHLKAERDLLVSCAENSKWVVPLVASFQDMNNLYLVMEYAIGGDFLGFLLRWDVVSEDVARWYMAEMILCVEEAHKMRWIHRDVKPDNFLITASGHLKISDFGLAFDGHWSHSQKYYTEHRYSVLKLYGIHVEGDNEDREYDTKRALSKSMAKITSESLGQEYYPRNRLEELRDLRRRLAKSVVGTSQYMAPEVVRGDPYDGRCDWWSIGIILFECLWGFTPFVRENREETKSAILMHRSLQVWPSPPRPVSVEVQDLIFRLLQEPEARLCSTKYVKNDYIIGSHGAYEADKFSTNYAGRHVYSNDAEDIKRHVFFAGIPWCSMHKERPPFVPKVRSDDSTKYFESEEQILGSDSVNQDDPSAEAAAAAASATVVLADEHDDQAMADLLDGPTGDNADRKDPKSAIPPAKKGKKDKQKKRPRDRLLRDPKTAKLVMEARKKSAFLGYTYRRPKTWSLGDDLRLAFPDSAGSCMGMSPSMEVVAH